MQGLQLTCAGARAQCVTFDDFSTSDVKPIRIMCICLFDPISGHKTPRKIPACAYTSTNACTNSMKGYNTTKNGNAHEGGAYSDAAL